VWSKSLDNSSDGEDFEPNAAQPNDSTRPYLEYGPSNFNLPPKVYWLFGYKVPNSGGSMQRLKNGWGFDSTVNAPERAAFPDETITSKTTSAEAGKGMTVRTWWDR